MSDTLPRHSSAVPSSDPSSDAHCDRNPPEGTASGGPPATVASFRRHIDEFDRSIIEFVVLWSPYGGPPHDEILPRFGILSCELPARVREIAYCGLRLNVPASDRALLVKALSAVEHTRPYRNHRRRHPAGPR